jgi:hypothetical protein
MPCFICTNNAFNRLSMQDTEALVLGAREFIHGMALSASQYNQDSFRDFQSPRRRGVCIVERCARAIETSCRGCSEPGCHRCRMAAELRAAEARINGERDAELAELGLDDKDLEEVVDKVCAGLCEGHGAFGAVLAGQWYSRRNFLISATVP